MSDQEEYFITLCVSARACVCTTVEEAGAKHLSLADLRAHQGLFEGKRTFLVHLGVGVDAALASEPFAGVEAASDGLVAAL